MQLLRMSTAEEEEVAAQLLTLRNLTDDRPALDAKVRVGVTPALEALAVEEALGLSLREEDGCGEERHEEGLFRVPHGSVVGESENAP